VQGQSSANVTDRPVNFVMMKQPSTPRKDVASFQMWIFVVLTKLLVAIVTSGASSTRSALAQISRKCFWNYVTKASPIKCRRT